MTKPAVLVTGGRTRAAYAVVRSLAAQGIPVYVADSTARSMSFYSHLVRKSFVYPSPFETPCQFVEYLNRIGLEYGIDVLLPIMEETYVVAKYRDQMEQYYRFALPDYQALLDFHDKGRWGTFATDLGIAVPRTLSMDIAAAAPERIEEFHLPVLLKPKQGGGGWGVKEVTNRQDLVTLLHCTDEQRGAPLKAFNVQEEIAGKTVCVAMLYDHGTPILTMSYEQLRNYPVPYGQSTLRRTIHHPAAEEALRRMLDAVKWHGVCQADFISDEATGRAYLIDINPRFWGAVALAEVAGIPFSYLTYRLALGESLQQMNGYQAGVYCRWLGGDLAALAELFRHGGDRLETLNLLRGPRGVTVGYDDFSLRDPLPFLGWCLDSLIGGVRAQVCRAPPHDALRGYWE